MVKGNEYKKTFLTAKRFGLVLSAVFLPMLFGCVAEPGVRVHASAGDRQAEVMAEDDYMYYPGYEVYYQPATSTNSNT